MKWLTVLIVVAGLAVIGYLYRDQIFKKPEARGTATAIPTPAPKAEVPTAEPATPLPSAMPAKPATARHMAPPGVYYMIERVSTTTADGIEALNVADHVLLVQKLPGGRMKVMDDGHKQFVIKESQATNDLDAARAAEEKDFMTRPGAELVPKQ